MLKTFCRADVSPLWHVASFIMLFAFSFSTPAITSAEAPDASSDKTQTDTIPPELFVHILRYDLPAPDAAYSVPEILSDITRGPVERMEISFTFDGGAEAEDASIILDALIDRGITTTMFVTGQFIRKYPGIVRRMVMEGHEVGNHTMTHPHLTDYAVNSTHQTASGVDKALVSKELKETAIVFKETTGTEMAPFWRAPFGEINDSIRRWAFEEGYLHVGWTADYQTRESLDTLDWVHDRSSRLYRSPDRIKVRVLGFGKNRGGLNGGIVLMHLGSERTDDKASSTLPEMLDELSSMGYRFVKVSRLVESDSQFVNLLRQKEQRRIKTLASIKEADKETSLK